MQAVAQDLAEIAVNRAGDDADNTSIILATPVISMEYSVLNRILNWIKNISQFSKSRKSLQN